MTRAKAQSSTITAENERDADLNARLARIGARLKEIERELPKLTQGSAKRSQLQLERADLLHYRRQTENERRALTAPSDPDAAERSERRKRFIDAEERERSASIRHFVAKLEAAGDHYQARLWRGELMRLRETIEREFP